MDRSKSNAVKKYILFDLDGTLTDPEEGITKCVQYALKSFGIDEPCLSNLRCYIGPPLKQSFMVYHGLDDKDAEAAVWKYRERYKDIGIYENSAYDGIADMLKKLRAAEKVLAIATSKPGVFAARIAEKYGLSEFLAGVYGSELDGSRTDKADVISYALSGLMAEPEQAVMVGDREHDILGAKKCGVMAVGVEFGFAEPGELEKAGADYIAETVKNLESILLAL
ncbi:MAG: HAD family hydrolase [Synergistaceae bacterium]|nr:HAD family hydrolase [Synergistaceae bacterium]